MHFAGNLVLWALIQLWDWLGCTVCQVLIYGTWKHRDVLLSPSLQLKAENLFEIHLMKVFHPKDVVCRWKPRKITKAYIKKKKSFWKFSDVRAKIAVLCQREILVKTKNTAAQLTAFLFPQLVNPSHVSAFQMQKQSRISLHT